VPGGRRHGVYAGQFDPFLPSVLLEKTPTLTQWHTHIALCDKDLCVCRFFEFARPLGGAVKRKSDWGAAQLFSH
jgi:hypothetical protein